MAKKKSKFKYKLDRQVRFDEKSRSFPIRELLEKKSAVISEEEKGFERLLRVLENINKKLEQLETLSSKKKNLIQRLLKRKEKVEKQIEELSVNVTTPNKIWDCVEHLDQGTEGACVGFAWTHELNATPFIIPVRTETAKTIYYAAQQWDEWEGTNYDGTSVLAGAKVVYSIGHMEEYRWAFGIEDVVDTLLNFGPVVLGVNWYEGMFDTDTNGFIAPTGNLAGGHAILAKGINTHKKVGEDWVELDEPVIILHNSWGTSWGVNGDAYIKKSDLDKLLKEQGEACVPVKRA